MAPVKVRFPEKLVSAFKSHLDAEVEVEKIARTPRYGFLVVSDRFRKMSPSKRQELVWKIVNETVTVDESFRISVILPVDPSEVNKEPARLAG